MFWQRFVELCTSQKLTPNAVAAKLGFSNASTTHWKQGATPRDSTLARIADYFSVSVEYLKGETDIKNFSADDSREMSKEAAQLFSILSEEHKIEAMTYMKYLAGKNNNSN